MDTTEPGNSGYELLLRAMTMIPISHYLFGLFLVLFIFWYNFLEFFLFEELLRAFRGCHVNLVYNSSSDIYHAVVSNCKVLHRRYLATPWLSSPHLQTVFLHFFGRPPIFSYIREVFHASDGGTIALDWLMSSDVCEDSVCSNHNSNKDDTTPIVAVIPGLANDSTSAYLKHLVFSVGKHGWNSVVINHRGLGGISVTSDCFYNAGWTEDVREVTSYLNRKHPKAPIFAVGTSIGANILVKFLGEDRESVAIAGAAAVCSPWDLLSRSIRDFDRHATCLIGKFETTDTYYRRCSSTSYVEHVSVPLLCISSLDDPVCTREAIPWDECRANKNIVLATTKHGGHLGFFEGITASSIWWVRAVLEFLTVLHASSYMHVQKKIENQQPYTTVESTIDHQGPFINLSDGMVAAVGNDSIQEIPEVEISNNNRVTSEVSLDPKPDTKEDDQSFEPTNPIGKCLNQLTRQNRTSMWLLVLVAISSTWPLVGAALGFVFKKRKSKLPAKIR